MTAVVPDAGARAGAGGPMGSAGRVEAAVLGRIDAEQIARLTQYLIAAASENPGGNESGAVAVLEQAMKDAGARTARDEVLPDRHNLIARFGSRSGGVLFLGHSDVVPAGAGWTVEPFAGRRHGDVIVGRGAADMKGGLAAVVAAVSAVHAEVPDLPMTLLCTVDEEADAAGIRHHVASVPPEHYSACIAAEPTSMVTMTGFRGATNLRIDVEGHSAHAGRPGDGASAILGAAEVIAAVEADDRRLQAAQTGDLGRASWSIGTIAGGHGTSIVPDHCTLTIDRRTLPGEDPDDILRRLLADARARLAARDPRLRVSGVVEMVMPGFELAADAPLIAEVRAAVRDAGGTGAAGVWTAACEGGFVARHSSIPTLVLGPGDLQTQAHQPDESVSVAELAAAARAYALIAMRLSVASWREAS